jgi:hypothetical protein
MLEAARGSTPRVRIFVEESAFCFCGFSTFMSEDTRNIRRSQPGFSSLKKRLVMAASQSWIVSGISGKLCSVHSLLTEKKIVLDFNPYIMNHIARIYQEIFAESNRDIPTKLLVLTWIGEGTARILCAVHGLPTFQGDDATAVLFLHGIFQKINLAGFK